MKIKQFPVGQMKANCYLVWDDDGEAIIIDPGDDADLVINFVQSNSLNPRLIVATHGHFDHVMSALELKLAFKIPLYMHKKDEFLLKRMDKTARFFLDLDPGPPPEVDLYLKNGAEISVGELAAKVIETPGHTPGSVCLYFENDDSVFVGDLVFEGGSVGRTDFKYADKQKLLKSIRQITSLPKKTLVYPGHGEITNIGQLQLVLNS